MLKHTHIAQSTLPTLHEEKCLVLWGCVEWNTQPTETQNPTPRSASVSIHELRTHKITVYEAVLGKGWLHWHIRQPSNLKIISSKPGIILHNEYIVWTFILNNPAHFAFMMWEHNGRLGCTTGHQMSLKAMNPTLAECWLNYFCFPSFFWETECHFDFPLFFWETECQNRIHKWMNSS